MPSSKAKFLVVWHAFRDAMAKEEMCGKWIPDEAWVHAIRDENDPVLKQIYAQDLNTAITKYTFSTSEARELFPRDGRADDPAILVVAEKKNIKVKKDSDEKEDRSFYYVGSYCCGCGFLLLSLLLSFLLSLLLMTLFLFKLVIVVVVSCLVVVIAVCY